MNLKRLLPITFYYLGDGSNKTVVINLAIDFYTLPAGTQNGVPVPSGVIFSSDPGDGSTVTNLLSIITLTLHSAPANGAVCSFQGYLLF